MRRALLLLAAWVVLGSATVRAQDLFDAIFPEKRHDFGTVARGSRLRHGFRLVNTSSYDLHIADVRTKCGCTDVKIGAREIPPGTQTVIEATLDTTRFQGYKASGLTLVFDRPTFREVDLDLTCFIRGDVVLNPGQVDFGVVPRGSKPTATLNLTYAGGRPNWGITKVHTISAHVSAKLTEVSRQGGTVQYQLVATLSPTAPSGYFKDEISLLTNDEASPSIPISVVANIQAAVTVLPSILNLGHVKANGTVTRDLLVRSSAAKPFKVVEVASKSPHLTARPASGAAAAFQKVTVTLKAPSQPGPYNATLEIATDLKGEPPAKVPTFATIVP
ncbi:MAG: DUF1573 domain-containing protein [Isosphaeraceae bacterium]|nr:DUF1573 domain-containing protein [Isosphaeraceae bacterium]